MKTIYRTAALAVTLILSLTSCRNAGAQNDKNTDVKAASVKELSTEAFNKTIYDILSADPELEAIKAYDVWQEKKLYGKVSMGVVRTTYLIDEEGVIVNANDKVKTADDADAMLNAVQG